MSYVAKVEESPQVGAEPKAAGCASTSSRPGASAFWSVLALLAVACVRRRESPR
ncbi:hypothetical protein DAT35_35645 [Vitiosangium sp. GDMCC 1.1324]|nr:hypothetical protein DAT35_35645 [Vitiosangium sp. GDMCC 1.1324]